MSKKTETIVPEIKKEVLELKLEIRKLAEENKQLLDDNVRMVRLCDSLTERLEKSQACGDNLYENSMFGKINKHSADVANRNILIVVKKDKSKKRREALEKAAKQNAAALAGCMFAGGLSLFAGAFGWVHSTLAVIGAATALVGLGWCLNTCAYILNRFPGKEGAK